MSLHLDRLAWRRGWFVGLMLALLAGCGDNHSTSAPADKPPPEPVAVQVVQARSETWPETVRVQGTFLADERSVIASKIAGRVEEINVDLGTVVRQGETLVLLDRRELQLHIDQAKAQLEQACATVGTTPDANESDLNRENAPPVVLEKALIEEARSVLARAEQLRPGNVITANEYERLVAQLKTAEARYDSALNRVGENIALIGVRRAELALAEERFAEAEIVAPFDAVVQQRFVSPGQYVEPGQQLAVLVRVDRLRFTAGVPESSSASIRVGQTVMLSGPGIANPVTASITRVSPMITQASRALWIEADVDNPRRELQAGLFAEAEIIVNPQQEVITAPTQAVSEFAGVQKVWVVRDGEAQQQTVRLGRESGGAVEVLTGLTPGDTIVANAAEARDGPVIASLEPSADPLSPEASGGSPSAVSLP